MKKTIFIILTIVSFLFSFTAAENREAAETSAQKTPENIKELYWEYCASCHGSNLEGTKAGSSLRDNKWAYGTGRKNIIKNIENGIVAKGMPAWQGTFSKKEIEQLADYIIAAGRIKRR